MRVGAFLALVALLGGIASSARTQNPVTPELEAGGPEGRSVLVAQGETLSYLADLHYGDASLWAAIYLDNRDRIKDPAVIYAGQRLSIPGIDRDQRGEIQRKGRELLRR